MRVGDFSVEIVATDGDGVREIDSGHVLARPGQVYRLRLRNHGPLRAVADVSIDGHSVTGNGLVIRPWSSVDLERPIHATERGRFTVIAEGNEQVFGPDGGRDNANLGLIEARFRRELPQNDGRRTDVLTDYSRGMPRPIVTMPSPPAPEQPPSAPPRRPFTPPEWTPPTWQATAEVKAPLRKRGWLDISALMAPSQPVPAEPSYDDDAETFGSAAFGDQIERAAGTGLTGSSSQEFVPTHVGPLETEATVIQLRIVIGTADVFSAPRPLPDDAAHAAPSRPAARP
jgi:hypothetical protein